MPRGRKTEPTAAAESRKRKTETNDDNPAPAKAAQVEGGANTAKASASPEDGFSWEGIDVDRIFIRDVTTQQQARYLVCYRSDPEMLDHEAPELVIKGVPGVVTRAKLHAMGDVFLNNDDDKQNREKIYGKRELQVSVYYGVIPEKLAKKLPKLADAHVKFARKMHEINEHVKELVRLAKRARPGMYEATERDTFKEQEKIHGGFDINNEDPKIAAKAKETMARAKAYAAEKAREAYFAGFKGPEYLVTNKEEDKGEMEITFKSYACFSNFKRLAEKFGWTQPQYDAAVQQLPLPTDTKDFTLNGLEIDSVYKGDNALFSSRYINYWDASGTVNLGQKALTVDPAAQIIYEGDVINFKFKFTCYNSKKGFGKDPLGMFGFRFEIDTYKIWIHARGPQVGELVTNAKDGGAPISGTQVADDYGFVNAFAPIEATAIATAGASAAGGEPFGASQAHADDDGYGAFS